MVQALGFRFSLESCGVEVFRQKLQALGCASVHLIANAEIELTRVPLRGSKTQNAKRPSGIAETLAAF